ncbi:hypothetical protein EI77_04739 [Prosthecobacter fusiformis]|uniref:Large polyvalent protein associated domain-containing protein n=1 Tax=Prosthecobacter fusiformis TaxID=48464 RepID=A0A4R7RJ83_9BACT|nr:hypothetical protein [Prosthecobacter fusiformis]TDU62101.1 hypothetical protein EI77_04739 [Prosthecobacter fusiformis]
MQQVMGRDEPEQSLRVAGAWRVEDLPAFLQDPMLKDATPDQRLLLLNDVLRQAGEEYARRPGFSREQFLEYQSVAKAARERVQEMKTWGETAAGVGGVVADALRGTARGLIATATDTTLLEPDAFLRMDEPLEFRIPLGNVAEQAGHWGNKAGDRAERLLSGDADKDLNEGLAELQRDLETANLPLGDRAALDAWVDNYARRLSAAQASWYEAVQGTEEKFTHKGKEEVMDQAWLQTYSKANGLNAPHNAALLARYLTTQDPQVLKQLTESLKKTPRRAAIERDQQESLDKSQVVNFLTNHMDGGDYAQVMAEAGNPLEIASNLVPLFRGARIASQAGKSALKVAGSAVGSVAADIALESVNLAVENPDAALADYLSNGRDVVAAALGLHGVGMVAGKTGQVMDRTAQDLWGTEGKPSPMDTPAGQPAAGTEKMPSEIHPQAVMEGDGLPGEFSADGQAPGSSRLPGLEPAPTIPGPTLSEGNLSPELRRQMAEKVRSQANQARPGLAGDDVIIVDSVDELLGTDLAREHPFTSEDIAEMMSAEGLYDKKAARASSSPATSGLWQEKPWKRRCPVCCCTSTWATMAWKAC